MADRVYLHVGAPKCGSTYLQTVLWGNRDRLADAGILLPGERMFQHNLAAVHARTARPKPRVRRVWERLVEQVQGHSGTAVLSNEWFSLADRAGAARTVAAFPGAEVHVVFTARDLTGVAPAAWQEQLKLGHGQDLDGFVAGLDDLTQRWSWATLDPAEVLPRWPVPPERVHLVVVPASRQRPTELWDRFAGVLGVPDGTCSLDVARPNESVSVVNARLLQELGPLLRRAIRADESPWPEQYRWLRRYVSHELLVPRSGAPIGLRTAHREAIRARSVRSIEMVRDAGYSVVGDLADLTGLQPDPRAVLPEDVTERELLEASYALAADLLAQLRATTDHQAAVPGRL